MVHDGHQKSDVSTYPYAPLVHVKVKENQIIICPFTSFAKSSIVVEVEEATVVPLLFF